MKNNLSIYKGALETLKIYALWEKEVKLNNCGAFCVFTGIVRSENGISGLSFDIYMPILQLWFNNWQKKAESKNARIFMAHSNGDVKVGESSYMCAIVSPNRKSALELYESFIEDFKSNAPIWKYDIIDNQRIYAKDRSKPINGAGIL
ncbi:molybdenum cofactor biosynthesis protein MoaE [Helicobacter sp. 16-1353]|uniref:molybdopterin synthase catalytic subunit n=1 Tax=Helicobacter sp. 16-1353 TaxID=2004996 RepID=UPI000DCD9385|nr:molybdenum cofactor biosynthesis protein MoaE [Helicobacter sp. 16-1353]RAX54739.1 molybdenum cofactor biosynthesis protein MoaE [Helicobacter sp. 16-1353]